MEFSKQFVQEYFAKQNSGGFYEFKENEATAEVIKLFTAERQKEVNDKIESVFGKFISLVYAQTWFEKNSNLTIYRFKGLFGETNNLEIRVVLNYEGKIAGFFVKIWSEDLN